MKQWLAVVLLLAMSTSVFAITCADGTHPQCHSGSGRGGGYRSVCSCVNDSCSFGFQFVPVGGQIVSYTMNPVTYPDSCANYEIVSQCVGQQNIQPPPAAYVLCNVSYPYDYGDD